MILGLFRISGHSMLPTLIPKSFIIASALPYLFSGPGINDIVVFKYNGQIMIKRIRKISGNKFLPKGDNQKDSLEIGWIDKKNIIGKCIMY